MIAALLAGGADPDVKDKQGDAALHIVVKKRRERTKDVEALLAGGADPCVRDRKRNIPIAYPEEGSRANRLLASAGGLDWNCDEKAVAEAPKQKPQEAADRNKATTATAAKQQPATKARPKSGTPQTRANPYTAACKALASALIEYANSTEYAGQGSGPFWFALEAARAAGAPGIAAYAELVWHKRDGSSYQINARAAAEAAKACPPPTNCKELRDAAGAWFEAAEAYIASPEPGNDAYRAVHHAQDFYHAAGLNAQAPVVVTAYESTVKAIVEFCTAEHGPDAPWCGGSVTNRGPQNHYRAAKAAAANSCR